MERTIGIAIGIPQPWGAELDAHRASTGDPAAALIPAHVTLLGPTIVAPSLDLKIDALLRAVAAGHEPFGIRLRGTGTFRPISPVVFVAVAAGVAQCGRLASAIRSGPLRHEPAHPYHPHVTVAHEIPGPAMDEVYERLSGYRADFEAQHFTLYEHSGDGCWKSVRDYRLGAQ